MNRLTKLIAVLSFSFALLAAPQGTPRSQIQNMVDKLNVTADQKAKLDPILDADAKQHACDRLFWSASGRTNCGP